MRNRQYSYDDGYDDYYDEEDDAEWEEQQRQYGASSGGGSYRGAGGGNSGNISLSSYFDAPGALQMKQPQGRQTRQREQQYGRGGSGRQQSRKTAQAVGKAAGTNPRAPAEDGDDAEIIAAVIAELELRLGRKRFSSTQLRQAVVDSQYEVDTAEVILLSSEHQEMPAGESWAPSSDPGSMKGANDGGPTQRLPNSTPQASENTMVESSPSPLAFGLCVDGQGEWRRTSRPTPIPPGFGPTPPAPPASSAGEVPGSSEGATDPTGYSSSNPASRVSDLNPFGFDTPSPDDVNIRKQAAARTRGNTGGGDAGGHGVTDGPRGAGTNSSDKSRPRASQAAVAGHKTDVTSPKAKTVHISGGAGPRGKNSAGAAGTGASPTGQRGQPSNERSRSPRLGGAGVGRAVAQQQQQQQATDASEMDEEGPEGKDRMAMVVIGHVDAGKSTLMGQVKPFVCVTMGRGGAK